MIQKFFCDLFTIRIFFKDVIVRTEKTSFCRVSHFALGQLLRKPDFSTARQISQKTPLTKAKKLLLKYH